MVALAENLVVAGRFRLNKLIGRGGMGSVWHATHLGLDVPCAVKFIEGENASLPEAHARFEREAKAAAQLRSPHVVQILDHGVWEGRPYIAMELLDGEDLKSRISKTGKLLPLEIGTIITQVCRALTKAHGLGIVHRDLKPDNIFLVRDDDREIAKVLDFGIAKRSDALDTGGSNTRTGAMLGTPYYMSPEQAQGVKTVDSRSDLWSLAVIVYQAIVGQLPFQSEALGDLLVKIIVQPLPVPSQHAQVPPNFDAWWAKATQRDPALRFQTAKDFGDSLMLSIGASQLTDVMDGRSLHGHLQSSQQSGAQLPFGSTPQPVMGYPQLAMTPQSAMAHSVMADTGSGAHPRGPQFGGTVPFSPAAMGSNPSGMAQSSGGFAAHGSTGAPFVTTSSGVMNAPPKKSNGALIGVIVAMIVLAAIIVVGTIKLTAPKTPPPIAASSSSAEGAKTNEVPPPPPTVAIDVAPTVAATTPPPPSASAAPTPSDATTAAANEHGSTSTGHSTTGSSTHPHSQGSASASSTTKTGSKSGADVAKMGF